MWPQSRNVAINTDLGSIHDTRQTRFTVNRLDGCKYILFIYLLFFFTKLKIWKDYKTQDHVGIALDCRRFQSSVLYIMYLIWEIDKERKKNRDHFKALNNFKITIWTESMKSHNQIQWLFIKNKHLDLNLLLFLKLVLLYLLISLLLFSHHIIISEEVKGYQMQPESCCSAPYLLFAGKLDSGTQNKFIITDCTLCKRPAGGSTHTVQIDNVILRLSLIIGK